MRRSSALCAAVPDRVLRTACMDEGDPMKPEEWHEPAPNWDDGESSYQRALLCLLFLGAHGVLSDGEKAKATKRLQKLAGVMPYEQAQSK